MIPPQGTDLAEHLALLRRRGPLLACALLLCVLGAVLGLLFVPPAYTATAQVLVSPTGLPEQNNQVTNRQRESLNLDTEAQIARSAVVAAKAASRARGAALEPAEVTVPPNSSVLSISVTAAEPALAAVQARAYAEAYLIQRAENAEAGLDAQLKALAGKSKQINTALTEVITELATLPKGTERTLATYRQNTLSRQAATLAARYDALKTVAVTPGSVISQAVPPTAPSRPSPPLFLGTGLMAGILCGVALAYLRDRLDTRLRTAADVERLTGLTVLADLSGPADPYELASSLIACCRGERLLVRAVPRESALPRLPLPTGVPFAVLDGSDMRDLARADAAVLLVTLRRGTATEVAATARHLRRHEVPVIGVIVAAAAGRRQESGHEIARAPAAEPAPARPHTARNPFTTAPVARPTGKGTHAEAPAPPVATDPA